MPEGLDQRPFADFPVHHVAVTRWSDNDMYGHLNNAVYYELFDSAINSWLARLLDAPFSEAEVIGVVAESRCRFFAELAFPGPLTVGVRVQRLGRTSVVYDVAIFDGDDPGSDTLASASGAWVHVYIDRTSRRSTSIPASLREALEALTEA